MKEKLNNSKPSSFVLTVDGVERRLNLKESENLNPSAYLEEANPVTSFIISVSETSLSLKILHENGNFVMPNWGLTKKHFGSDEKIFDISLTDSAFMENHHRKQIAGSHIFFNNENTLLTGNNWTLEYKPL